MSNLPASFTLTKNQPLIGIPFEENGREVVRYFSEDKQAEQMVPHDATKTALELAGAWRDLSWEQTKRELERIRHETKPTPPIDLDV